MALGEAVNSLPFPGVPFQNIQKSILSESPTFTEFYRILSLHPSPSIIITQNVLNQNDNALNISETLPPPSDGGLWEQKGRCNPQSNNNT